MIDNIAALKPIDGAGAEAGKEQKRSSPTDDGDGQNDTPILERQEMTQPPARNAGTHIVDSASQWCRGQR
jgi:hypothetical protein